MVSKRRKDFATAHKSDEDCQAYTSAFRHASSVIAKAKAGEAWQTTCSSLFPKSDTKSMYSIFHAIVGSSSSFSSSRNFSNCSSPEESASVFVDYLRSHFSVSQPKPLRSDARAYLSEFRRATCPEEFYSSFYSSFFPIEFLAVTTNLSSFFATGPNKVAKPVLKNLPRSVMDFLLHIFDLSWYLHFFPFI